MTEAKHTPTPWFLINAHCVGGPSEPGWEEAGCGIAHCGMRARTQEEAAANAALIVSAVNAYAAAPEPPAHDDAVVERVEEPWLIVKRDLYYRPHCEGYTGIRDSAGRYSREEAEAEACGREDEISIVKLSEAPEFTKACYPDLARDHLRKERDELRAAIVAMPAQSPLLNEAAEALRKITVHQVGDQSFITVAHPGRGSWSADIEANGRDIFEAWFSKVSALLSKLEGGK